MNYILNPLCRLLIMVSAIVFLYGCKTTAEWSPKTYSCQWTNKPIKLDGNLNDAAWKIAKPLWKFRRFTDPYPIKGHESLKYAASLPGDALMQTEAKMMWDDQYLYIGAKILDKDIYSPCKNDDTPTWSGDAFELFFKPSTKKTNYYELQVTPSGIKFDAEFARRGCGQLPRFIGFDSKMAKAVAIKGTLNNFDDVDEYWTVEIRIPFCAFKTIPKQNDEWRFNLGRYNYSKYLPEDFIKGCEVSSTARDLKIMGFHFYERYDIMKFVKND